MGTFESSRTGLKSNRRSERGAALAMALLMLAVMGAIAMTVLAVVHTETKIAGSDLERTQAFSAATAGIEKMTSDFNALFTRTSRPTAAQLSAIASSPPDLTSEGFTFPSQSIVLDEATLAAMRATQGITNGAYPHVTIPTGPFAGLTASVTPYTLSSVAQSPSAEVSLTRQMNNYQVPIFQFGMFSNEDLEIHPGPDFAFNGRVHANGNLYLNGNVKFFSKVTTAAEVVRDVLRNGGTHDGTVSFDVNGINVKLTKGSVNAGPNISGNFPGSPAGTRNTNWKTQSVGAPQAGVNNKFGGQLQTSTTGVSPLLLPLQLDGNPTRELIKRKMPNDDTTLSDSRFHTKAEIRILIDDETPSTTDASGIPAGQGVALSSFAPIPLPNVASSSNGGRALWRVKDDGTYNEQTGILKTYPMQENDGSATQALTVRGVNGTTQSVTLNGTETKIPAGSGLTGRILIEIVDIDGNRYDVTTEILSMGMTVGEPNSIIHLQRPLWAAFVQGSRDASGSVNPVLNGDLAYTNCLTDILSKTHIAADGEIKSSSVSQNTTYGYLTSVIDDTDAGAQPERADTPASAGNWNGIVPINVYNIREGRTTTALDANSVYERGITNIVEINMRNFARWLDGVYDDTLLVDTDAVSSNIAAPDGFIVYISDRRGDKVKSETDSSGATISTTNGMVDNEDIYGNNNSLDPGEDVIDFGFDLALNSSKKGTLQRDLTELPYAAALGGTSGADFNARVARGKTVSAWLNPSNYFRRSVRLFNGENLQITGDTDKLSTTKGITISSENMIYVWGNYNTTGINAAPPNGVAALNDPNEDFFYNGNQVPAAIICDAFWALSKTWFDALASIHPDSVSKRPADASAPGVTAETSMRMGVIAGNNMSALAGIPDAGNSAEESRLSGGVHNFPRFLEDWSDERFNLVGSLIPLWRSTQALGQYNANSTHYSPPIRDWAFDVSFLAPDRLPPGTPQFQYIEATGFRQNL
jgi:Tfp pilus assembly protein PilX